MSEALSDRPDARRLELYRSVIEPSSLDDVTEAVAAASENERRIYVERTTDGYRWSLVHPGGAYPLLRITARFLRVDYSRIMVPFRKVAEGVFVSCGVPDESTSPTAWAVLELEGPTTPDAARERILSAL